MSAPLKNALCAVGVALPLLLAGCSNTQLAQHASEQELAAQLAQLEGQSSYQDQPVLYPTHFSLRLRSGASGSLLPEDVDTQLQPLMEQLAQWQQVTRIVVVGHTDGEGSEKSNLLLSLRRANAVADKLADYGLPEGAMEVDGRGELVPIADNNSISGRKLNRRIEIVAEGFVAQSKNRVTQR